MQSPSKKVLDELEYEVMPQLNKKESKPIPPGSGSRHRMILIGGIVLALLAGGGYLTYLRFFKSGEPNQTSSKPSIVVDDLPNIKDSDNDGLADEREKALGTNPDNPDSDKDGLADGDEANIYLSDPLLFDTDGDGFEDGQESAGGWSPIVNTKEKAASDEVQRWTDRIAQYGLHEPTKTTLKVKASRKAEEQKTTTYANAAYGYSIEVPQVLATREADSGRNVGIYIAGTVPEDPNVATDPISITIAVKVENQTLEEWVAGQYQEGKDYQLKTSLEINSVKAIQLTGVQEKDCPSNKTFFAKNGTIIVASWTCNEISPIGTLYDGIIKSFKFQ